MAANLADGCGLVPRHWDRELKSAVRTSFVVMADVFAEHGLKMAPGVDEEMVEALFAYGSYP